MGVVPIHVQCDLVTPQWGGSFCKLCLVVSYYFVFVLVSAVGKKFREINAAAGRIACEADSYSITQLLVDSTRNARRSCDSELFV